MATKSRLVFSLFLFFLCGFSFLLYAQSEDDEHRFIHRFAWASDYALRYEVVFEQIENGAYIFYLREFTDFQFIELSLPVGRYRFQVIPYDVLNRPSEPSEWRYIQVIPVPKMEIEHEAEPDIKPQPELEPESKPEPELEPEPQPEVRKDSFELKPLGSVIFSVTAAWSPLFPIYGDGFGNSISLSGAIVRASAIFHVQNRLYIGPELTSALGINLFALKWLANERIAFGIRAGVEYPIIFINADRLIVNIGASLRLRITNSFLLETGVDFSHLFTDFPSGSFRPWIGIGYQF